MDSGKKPGPLINTPAEESSPMDSRMKNILFHEWKKFISLPMKQNSLFILEEHLHGTVNGLGDIYQLPLSVIMNNSKWPVLVFVVSYLLSSIF